jgi:hypothetical protein
MKAKEYAQQIINAESDIDGDVFSAIGEVMARFVTETVELAQARNVSTVGGVASCVTQQHQKWQALCRILETHYRKPVLKTDGYVTLLRDEFPDYYNLAIAGGFMV